MSQALLVISKFWLDDSCHTAKFISNSETVIGEKNLFILKTMSYC